MVCLGASPQFWLNLQKNWELSQVKRQQFGRIERIAAWLVQATPQMKKYHNRPLAFANATLVRLVQRESLRTILTGDFDNFETYRVAGGKRFRILPSR